MQTFKTRTELLASLFKLFILLYCSNAVLQGLLACDDLCRFWLLLARRVRRGKTLKTSMQSPYLGKLAAAWMFFLEAVFLTSQGSGNRRETIITRHRSLYDIILAHHAHQFSPGTQGDAHEFLQILLAGLCSELSESSSEEFVS